MMELAVALFSIIMVNLVLSGDNAVIIAMASRNLAPGHQKKAILWGTGGAVVLRIMLTFVAAWLLTIPYLQCLGGILLIWIAVKLLIDDSAHNAVKESSSFGEAIKTIIAADLVMSLDNTLGIAAIANGHFWLLSFGLLLSIPIVVFGSQLMINIMSRFPVVIYIGAGLISWAAGVMIHDDQAVGQWVNLGYPDWLLPLIITVGTVGFGYWKKSKTLSNI